MPVMIQIRNVPESLHRKLKVRAAEAGMSLSDFLLADLRDDRTARQPLTGMDPWKAARSAVPK